ncbi:PilN domain-containing protein [Thermodesulfatator indicus]
MIKINLIPKKEKKAAKDYKIAALVVLMIFSYVLIGASYFYLKKKEARAHAQVAQINQKVKKYKKIEKELNKIKKETKKIEKRIDIIISLIKDNPKVIKNIDLIVHQIPVGKVSLIKVEVKKDNINIVGQGMTLKDIASFIQRLEQQEYINKVYLANTKRDKNNKLINFNLRVKFKNES